MTKDRLNKLVDEAVARREVLRRDKGEEYTRGNEDQLANFKGIAKEMQPVFDRFHSIPDSMKPAIAAMAVWFIYARKHREISNEPISGRIDDLQVYFYLFRGLADEGAMKNKQEIKSENFLRQMADFISEGHALGAEQEKLEDEIRAAGIDPVQFSSRFRAFVEGAVQDTSSIVNRLSGQD